MNLVQKRDFMTSPYRSEREKLIFVRRWNVRRFFNLIQKLKDFFEYDKCNRLADNYLIAMVFTYFLRVPLEPDEYTFTNFFAALYLAYNMEEDEDEYLLYQLEPWLDCSVASLKQARYELFKRLECRAAVSCACCDIVMRSAQPEHTIWKRKRHSYHSGVIKRQSYGQRCKAQEVCPTCNGESDEDED